MPFNLEFNAICILNPCVMLFHPVQVLLKGFEILIKIISTHCEMHQVSTKRVNCPTLNTGHHIIYVCRFEFTMYFYNETELLTT